MKPRLKAQIRRGGMTSPEIIREYIKAQECWICGKGGWKALSQHLVKKHGLPAIEVREIAYMFKRESLISLELSEELSRIRLQQFNTRGIVKNFNAVKGKCQPNHVLSKKARDILRKRVKEIRPLASIAQQKRRKAHQCKVCGKLIETSRPRCCSPKCVSMFLSENTKANMTPERIANFKKHLYKASAEELSIRAKKNWKKIRSWPVEQQKAYFLKRAESRKAPLVNVPCVVCGTEFFIPIYRLCGKRRSTCSRECSRILHAKRSRERVWKDSSRAKLSALAKTRHVKEPLFGRGTDNG